MRTIKPLVEKFKKKNAKDNKAQRELRSIKVALTRIRRNPSWVLDRLEQVADLLSNQNNELFDPKTAHKYLESLGKYHKLFTEKVEISIREDLGEKIRDARRRASLRLKEIVKIDGATGDQTTVREIELSADTPAQTIDLEGILNG